LHRVAILLNALYVQKVRIFINITPPTPLEHSLSLFLSSKPTKMTILSETSKLPHFDSFLANSKVPQGQTDELLTWLFKVNQKKISVRSTRNRDLRKEAMLEASRRAAQESLEAKQRERRAKWQDVMNTWTPPTPPPPPETDDNLCDCEACFLCQRHKPEMHGKCYCNVIFSPRPMFMDFVQSNKNYDDNEESMEVDNFLASLNSSSNSSIPINKRKHSEIEEESDDSLVGRKRATA